MTDSDRDSEQKGDFLKFIILEWGDEIPFIKLSTFLIQKIICSNITPEKVRKQKKNKQMEQF